MFFPETIDLSESEKYILAIRLQKEYFSFAIYEPGRNEAFVYRETFFSGTMSYFQQVQRTVFNSNFLSQPYLRTWVEIVSPRYAIVPASYYDAGNREAYLSQTLSGECGHAVAEPFGGEGGGQLIFDVDTELYTFLSRHLFSPTFTHHTTSLSNLFNSNKGKLELRSKMYLYFSGQQVDVFVIRNGEVLTMQSFVDESEQDIFYFAMNIWKAFELDQINDRLYLSGNSEKYIPLIPLFSRFIQYVEQKGAPSEAFLFGPDAAKTPIDLFALIL